MSTEVKERFVEDAPVPAEKNFLDDKQVFLPFFLDEVHWHFSSAENPNASSSLS